MPRGSGWHWLDEGEDSVFSFWAQTAAAVAALQHRPRWHSLAVLHAWWDRQPLQSLNYSAQAGPIC